MTRETENVLLLLVGISSVMIVVTGTFTRYVKPSLMPWLLAGALVVIVLAIAAIVRDVRRGEAADTPDGPSSHGHRHHSPSMLWVLIVPVIVLTFVIPPPIGADAANTTVREVSTDVLRREYPPLPDGPAPEVSLPEVLMRARQDTTGSLNGRTISITGFTMRSGDAVALARIVIICCAADAQLARIALSGPVAREVAKLPDETWLSVEGVVSGDPPKLQLSRFTPVEAPENAYAY